MDLIKELNKEALSRELPKVEIGDTVRVHVKVKEGSRERIKFSKRGRGGGLPPPLPLYRHHSGGPQRQGPPGQALLPARPRRQECQGEGEAVRRTGRSVCRHIYGGIATRCLRLPEEANWPFPAA